MPSSGPVEGLAAHEARWLEEEFGHDPAALAAAIERRRAHEPLQYVLGHWPFRRLDLVVDRRVLIPRFETEGLVDVALVALGERARAIVVDLGCGSGAIGLALASELAARGVVVELYAVDLSEEALDVARENARRCGVAVHWRRGSWYEALEPELAGRVDLIVANPPYVAAAEMSELAPELAYEPRGALVAEDTPASPGFADLAEVIAGAPRWLAPGGVLVAEHGADQGEAVLAAARAAGMREAIDHPDLSGRARVLEARR